VFIEKFIDDPRHIEIQVLADAHGNVVHLGERECSIQRRHQKVIEEAPSPFLDAETRAAMGAQAVALAKTVDYRSAGTVEFIVDKNKDFYFLEMNTRIQVEHPVTELVTGLDLVEWMIRIAAGEPLDAEDPLRHFLPSIGRLVRYVEPTAADLPEGARLRVDSGVIEGSEVTMFYDPMIAKVVTHAADRSAAIDAMQAALNAFYVRGVNHNMSFLTAVMAQARFREGRLTTNYIAEEFPDGFHGYALPEAVVSELAAVAAVLQRRQAEVELAVSGQLDGHIPAVGADWAVVLDGQCHPVVLEAAPGGFKARVEGREIAVVSDWHPGQALFRGRIGGDPKTIQVDRRGPCWRLSHGGGELEALVLSGEELAVVEAMKMENVLRAERDGIVARVHAEPGGSLAVGQAILEFE
jgi:propionyl-CoA carboxylase alpha chain